MPTDVAHAYARFWFGRGPQDPAPADVRGWLAGQLSGAAVSRAFPGSDGVALARRLLGA